LHSSIQPDTRISRPSSASAFGAFTFRYYLAHGSNSSPDDSLRVLVQAEDGTQTAVFEELGAADDDDATWSLASRSLADWAGQTIRIVIEATDGGSASTVEAGIDDLRIRRP
jgi:hypothetical protein